MTVERSDNMHPIILCTIKCPMIRPQRAVVHIADFGYQRHLMYVMLPGSGPVR